MDIRDDRNRATARNTHTHTHTLTEEQSQEVRAHKTVLLRIARKCTKHFGTTGNTTLSCLSISRTCANVHSSGQKGEPCNCPDSNGEFSLEAATSRTQLLAQQIHWELLGRFMSEPTCATVVSLPTRVYNCHQPETNTAEKIQVDA